MKYTSREGIGKLLPLHLSIHRPSTNIINHHITTGDRYADVEYMGRSLYLRCNSNCKIPLQLYLPPLQTYTKMSNKWNYYISTHIIVLYYNSASWEGLLVARCKEPIFSSTCHIKVDIIVVLNTYSVHTCSTRTQ